MTTRRRADIPRAVQPRPPRRTAQALSGGAKGTEKQVVLEKVAEDGGQDGDALHQRLRLPRRGSRADEDDRRVSGTGESVP
jgi:hypothetical protein